MLLTLFGDAPGRPQLIQLGQAAFEFIKVLRRRLRILLALGRGFHRLLHPRRQVHRFNRYRLSVANTAFFTQIWTSFFNN